MGREPVRQQRYAVIQSARGRYVACFAVVSAAKAPRSGLIRLLAAGSGCNVQLADANGRAELRDPLQAAQKTNATPARCICCPPLRRVRCSACGDMRRQTAESEGSRSSGRLLLALLAGFVLMLTLCTIVC